MVTLPRCDAPTLLSPCERAPAPPALSASPGLGPTTVSARASDSLLSERDVPLLLQRLRTAEAALDNERVLGERERAVLAERLAFAESQDEAARERLSQVLASFQCRQNELQEIACSAAGVELDELNERVSELQSLASKYEHAVHAAESDAHLSAAEATQSSKEKEELGVKIARQSAEWTAEAAEYRLLECAAHKYEQAFEECRHSARAELALADAERVRVTIEVKELLHQGELQRQSAMERQVTLEAERRNWMASRSEQESLAQREQQRLESEFCDREAALRTQADLKSREHTRAMSALSVECREKDLRIATINDELTMSKSREQSQLSLVEQLEVDLGWRGEVALSEVAAMRRAKSSEEDLCKRLKCEMKEEVRAEAEAVRSLRAELLEARQGNLQRVGLQNEMCTELRRAQEVQQATMDGAERRERDLLAQLNSSRRAYEDLETSVTRSAEALKHAAIWERDLGAERCERLRCELQSEVQDVRRQFERQIRDAEVAATQQERGVEIAVIREARKSERDLQLQLQACTRQAASASESLAARQELLDERRDWCRSLDAQVREVQDLEAQRRWHMETDLHAEIQRWRTEVGAKQRDLDAECVRARDAQREEAKLRSELLSSMQDAARAYQRQFDVERSRESLVSARAELRDTSPHWRHEAAVAKDLKQRVQELESELSSATFELRALKQTDVERQCTQSAELERELLSARMDLTAARRKVRDLEGDLLDLRAQLRKSEAKGFEGDRDALTLVQEYRRSHDVLREELSAAQAETLAAKTQLHAKMERQALLADEALGSSLRQRVTELEEELFVARRSLARSEEKRVEGIRCMDAFVADTQVLARSLNEHQHLAKDLNDMILRHEVSVSTPNSRANSPIRDDVSARTSPIVPNSSQDYLSRDLERKLTKDIESLRHRRSPRTPTSPRTTFHSPLDFHPLTKDCTSVTFSGNTSVSPRPLSSLRATSSADLRSGRAAPMLLNESVRSSREARHAGENPTLFGGSFTRSPLRSPSLPSSSCTSASVAPGVNARVGLSSLPEHNGRSLLPEQGESAALGDRKVGTSWSLLDAAPRFGGPASGVRAARERLMSPEMSRPS